MFTLKNEGNNRYSTF